MYGLHNDRFETMKSNIILLVEDDKLIQTIEALLITEQGFEVDIAMNGREALQKVHTNHYRLVLMDIGLPDQDGLTLTRQLRRHYSSLQLPIVALTAHNSQETENACIQAGMNGFICKPLTTGKLLCVLQQFIQ